MPSSSTTTAVAKHTDALPPLFSVSFTNGMLDSTKYNNISSKVLKHKRSERVRKLVVNTGDMDYAGDYDHLNRDEGKYIGVEDPETMQMTLIPIKRVRLRPAISIGQEADEVIEEPKKSRQEQNDSLIALFGGAKQKQNMLMRKKHGINKDMIYAALDSAGVENIPVTNSATPSTPKTEADHEILPPHDMETINPNKCYPLDGYLPPHVREDLGGFVDDFVVDAETLAEWKKSNRYPEFILTQLENLPLEESSQKKTAIHIKYLLFLMRLHKLKAADLKLKDPFSSGDSEGLYQMPASCFNHLLDTYTVKSARLRSFPSRLKDKVLVVILLLALRLERYSFCCNKLMSDIKVGGKKISVIAKAMGCRVKLDRKKDVPEIIIELNAPLKFPVATPGPRKKNTNRY